MPFSIEKKLVIAIASSALFDLSESDRIFQSKGTEAYRRYQRRNENKTLSPGVAFPFIRRLLGVNSSDESLQPVEVILLSRNDYDTGLRIFKSIEAHRLDISRGAFLSGDDPYRYLSAFNASLFLSANPKDVRNAVKEGYPAGVVLKSSYADDANDLELRIGFDFDGVLADDAAEKIYRKRKMAGFHKAEKKHANIAHNPGPLKDLFHKIAEIQSHMNQKLDAAHLDDEKKIARPRITIRTAIITARNAPSHERVVTTLRKWKIDVDATFFLGGMEKKRILEVFRPHVFFDDQLAHLETTAGVTPSVHIPFGVANNE